MHRCVKISRVTPSQFSRRKPTTLVANAYTPTGQRRLGLHHQCTHIALSLTIPQSARCAEQGRRRRCCPRGSYLGENSISGCCFKHPPHVAFPMQCTHLLPDVFFSWLCENMVLFFNWPHDMHGRSLETYAGFCAPFLQHFEHWR